MELNWPTTALLLGLATLLLFRGALTRLLERTEKVKDWLVAPKQPTPAAPADDNLPTRDATSEQRALEELTRDFDNHLLVIQEESIKADLAKHSLSAESSCEKVLIRHLAGTQIALHFEKAYNGIFESQLRALRWLNSHSTGVSSETLRPFYDQAVRDWPVIYRHRDFKSWLGFMATYGLITESAEPKATSEEAEPFGLQISELGREFLAFLVRDGRADPPWG